VQRGQLAFRNRRIDHGHAARLAVRLGNGIERGGVVGAMATSLDDHVLVETQMIAQGKEHVRPGIFGRYLALALNGNRAIGPKTWQCASIAPAGGV
jgi:hypothetical protein